MIEFSQENPCAITHPFGNQLSVAGRIWQLKVPDERLSLAISQRHQVPLFLSTILAARGHSLASVSDFLNPTLKTLLPDPSHLKDLDQAVHRVIEAIEKDQKIIIFADYDVDGATSSALIRRYLRDIGINADVYIPNRIEEGYGPNVPAMHTLHQQGYQLIVMVDCGTTAFEPLACATQLGMDVIVIDHHTAQAKLPEAYAIINPNRLDEASPLTHLCAAGLSFVFLVGLHRALRQQGWFTKRAEPDLRRYLDLVALGTVCDVMPLKGLNRAYVAQGLKVMRQRGNLGLNQLLQHAQLEDALSAYHLGFILGPRINAGGRVGQADFGSRLLSTEILSEAQYFATQLEGFNKERQVIEQQVLDQAITQIERQNLTQHPLIMVAEQGWHPGVIGIVASRLKERFNRPACVVGFHQDIGKGSGRSIPNVHLGNAMHTACHKGLLVHGGGHAMAAGFTVERAQYDSFYEHLIETLKPQMTSAAPIFEVDGVLSPSGATIELIEQLNLLEPYGSGNPMPRFVLNQVKIGYATVVGNHHIKCDIYSEDGTRLKAIAFRAVDTELGQFLLQNHRPSCHIAGTLKLDTWLGQSQVSLTIEDVMVI